MHDDVSRQGGVMIIAEKICRARIKQELLVRRGWGAACKSNHIVDYFSKQLGARDIQMVLPVIATENIGHYPLQKQANQWIFFFSSHECIIDSTCCRPLVQLPDRRQQKCYIFHPKDICAGDLCHYNTLRASEADRVAEHRLCMPQG